MSSSSSSSVVYEGWMIRYGRRKIGRSFVHTRYFVLEPRMLSYYKRKPQHKADKVGGKLPIKSLHIDGNCRVEDRGLKMHHGHMLYVLCVYNKREKHNRITMAAFNIQEALIWKEKIEMVIDQRQGVALSDGNKAFSTSQQEASLENGRKSSSSDHESQIMDFYQNNMCPYSLMASAFLRSSKMLITLWDCSFQYGSLVEEVDGHTAILYHRLQLDWFPMFVWPRDLCYVRYWRRNDDGSYGWYSGGGFNISPLKSRNGRIRTQVQHLMQIDLKGWGVGYVPSFQQHCLLHMLNSVAGLREWFSQSDESQVLPRIPVMVNMTQSVSSKKGRKAQESTTQTGIQMDPSRHSTVLEEESDEDDEFLIPESEPEPSNLEDAADVRKSGRNEEDSDLIDLSGFSGNLRRDDRDSSRDCWRMSDGNNFRVRSKNFVYDKSKIPAGKPLMELVAVDWFKDAKRMDHVARRKGCAVQVAAEKGLFALAINLQVPGTTNYSMVFYFVTKKLIPNSLLQRFVDGDDEFRNSRFKLIPSVPKGSWIVRQSVGSTPCLLGKAVDITYIRGSNYLEIDVDIGSSTVANGVLGLVCGVITTLVVDMAFLVQANTYDELPERLIGAVRMSHIELSSAIVPVLED
ncbi:Protein ENHANCED DISEASE RESISTANCE 2 [Zea mays]|uniref:Protein ENHANCED DISEASE RESISTANCE 2 n=1 Tax=Zea mays TaxID=4577 RepID=A0A3L6EPK7_MAIZE|nr:Protein ENHANCED DISEASE RESISTANCE 2 [Zea mays]